MQKKIIDNIIVINENHKKPHDKDKERGKIMKAKKIAPATQVFLDQGDAEIVDIDSLKEQWSEYTLKDGATIRLKPVVVEIRKLKNQFAPNGDPIYLVKSTVINDTKIPDSLKKKK